MSGVARLGDSITGTTTGEHHGHYNEDGEPIHGVGTITGSISSNCSSNVYVNGKPVAFVGSSTTEYDNCGTGYGKVATGSSKVYVNGKPIARNGDSISAHNGSARISSGSSNVIAN